MAAQKSPGFANSISFLFYKRKVTGKMLRNVKPLVGERKEVSEIPAVHDISGVTPPDFYTQTYSSSTDIVPADDDNNSNTAEEANGKQEISNENETQQPEPDQTVEPPQSDEAAQGTEVSKEDTPAAEVTEAASKDDNESSDSTNNATTGEDAKDDDSDEAVGKDEALELDRNMEDNDGNDDNASSEHANESVNHPEGDGDQNATKVSTMFQKILSLGGGAGQVVVDVGSGDGLSSSSENA
ncbi:MAG: hypothetical protein SGARI_002366, partial [Bacillariaceae sp.]